MSQLEAIQIVELSQPRCGLRFGVGVCTAVGTPLCYNTYSTCTVRAVYAQTGSIKWRFVKAVPGTFPVGDFTDADNVATNAIPVEMTVSNGKGQLNIAGVLDGKSPFGVRATVSVSMKDFEWADSVGDFYLGSRVNLPPRSFWSVWTARNQFFGGMYVTVYDGYRGDALASMRKRVYVLDKVDGPQSDGTVTLHGSDPLMLAATANAKFPRDMDVRLTAAITDSQTTIQVLSLNPLDLTDAFGNTVLDWMKIGSEIFSYSAATFVSAGVYDLTGCTRGQLGTVAATGAVDVRLQRVGRYEDIETWAIGYDLMINHAKVPTAFIDYAQWADEGGTYLPSFRTTVTLHDPEPIPDLMGEICQQGMFYIWWNEFAQTVPMLAVRPPKAAVRQISDATTIMAGSSELTREPESLISRVFVYYSQINILGSKTEAANYRVVSGRVEGAVEHASAAGGPRPLSIYARFVNTEGHASQLISGVLGRYSTSPRFLTIRVSAKDREITIGEVCDVTTRTVLDTEGRALASRWQVISWDEVIAGEVYLLDLQTYDFIGRFGQFMASGSPDFASATDEEKNNGGWWAETTGLMPDGSAGYQWQ